MVSDGEVGKLGHVWQYMLDVLPSSSLWHPLCPLLFQIVDTEEGTLKWDMRSGQPFWAAAGGWCCRGAGVVLFMLLCNHALSHSTSQPLCQSARVAGAATQPLASWDYWTQCFCDQKQSSFDAFVNPSKPLDSSVFGASAAWKQWNNARSELRPSPVSLSQLSPL